MFPAKKELANGKVRYYIRYRNDDGKLVYYPKSKYPDFYSFKEAELWINANRNKVKDSKKQADILRIINAKSKYVDFQSLTDKFLSVQKSDAPNSWESSMLYLDNYIYYFFIIQKQVYDVNEWYLYFEDFIIYLETEATVHGKKKLIEFSTKNHCIRTLNKFLSVMQRFHILDIKSPLKCRSFPKHKLNTRGFKDLITQDEYSQLKKDLDKSKDFFIILYNTGMRFNELYSLSIDDVRDMEDLPIHLIKRFESYKVKIYGFISLESQIDGKVRSAARLKASKNSDHLFKRKPLKSCKKIDAQNRRIIPIFDKETWDIMVRNYNVGCVKFEKGTHGTNPKDYFLLDMDPSVVRREFAKYTKKGFHSCRHTFITNLVGKYRDMAMTRLISGHKSDAFEAYVHIYEQYAEQVGRKISFKPKKLSIA